MNNVRSSSDKRERHDTTHVIHEVLRNHTRTIGMTFVVHEVLRNYTRTVGMILNIHEVPRNYTRTVGMTKILLY